MLMHLIRLTEYEIIEKMKMSLKKDAMQYRVRVFMQVTSMRFWRKTLELATRLQYYYFLCYIIY